MALHKRVRKGVNFKPKGLDKALHGIRSKGGSEKEQLRIIKTALFSRDIGLRMRIADDLIKWGQFRFLMDMARKANKKHFPADFFREKFRFGEFPSKYWPLPEKNLRFLVQQLVKAVNKGPAFRYKGFGVYEMEGDFPQGGMLYHGSIYVGKNLSKKMKMIICAHEVGEIFHHQVGIGMELLEAKGQNAEREYLEWIKTEDIERIREASNTAEKMPGMKEIAKKLMEIRKKKAISGP